MSSGWPLVGRNEELRLLADALGDPAGARCVVIAGPAGVGKTRLAAELLALVSAEGATTRWAVASASAQSVPFGAFAPLLPPATQADAGPDGVQMLGWAARSIRAAANGNDVVLGVDDAHQLDDLSATLVHQLALSADVSLILTVRTGEGAPDAVVAVWKDSPALRIELQPLGRVDVEELLSSVLPGEIDVRTIDRLWNLSLGNLLYLRSLVEGGLESGDLREIDGVWRLEDHVDPPPRLIELVSSRLDRLEPTARAVLEVLACGEPLGVELLSRLVPVTPLAELERRGLVAVETSGKRTAVRIGHPLYTQVLRSRMPVLEGRDIYRRLADAVEACGARRREDLLRVATWRLESRSPADPLLMARAAVAANNTGDYDLGERLARASLDSGATSMASLALGVSLRWQTRIDEAAQVLLGIDLDHVGPEDRVSIASSLSDAFVGLGLPDRALAVLAHAEHAVADPLRTYTRALRACLLAQLGRAGDAIDLGVPLIEGPDVDERIKLRAISGAGAAWIRSGRAEAALQAATGLFDAALRHQRDLPYALRWIGGTIVEALVWLGNLDEATALLEGPASNMSGNNPVLSAQIRFAEGRIALFRGRPATALRLLRESSGVVPAFGLPANEAWGRALIAEALALIGDVEGARSALERAAAGSAMYDAYIGDRRRAEAWVAAACGETSKATSLLMSAATTLSEQRQLVGEACVLHDAARLGASASVVGRLCELQSKLDGRWAPAYALHATGLATEDAAKLEEAAEAFEAIGATLVAAEAAHQAAAANRRSGLLARASAATARGERLAALCEGAHTPALSAAARPLPLTRREREVATLAASGLSSREIADRLVVSVRTVESHLQQAYTKLGVSSREELRAVLAK